MNRLQKIQQIRATMLAEKATIGSWIQIPHSSIAEIMGQAGYDWVAVDMEHGAISVHQLPDIFRALELGDTLPLVRLAQGHPKDCKQVLDAGAGGVIIPMVESAEQLRSVRDAVCWPPSGKRGVAFSRANLFGKNFNKYIEEAQSPIMVAMIEHVNAVNNLDEILQVEGLDAILIGPYDLSASMGKTAQFNDREFTTTIHKIVQVARKYNSPFGIHVVNPSVLELQEKIQENYRFIAYSMDSVFLRNSVIHPLSNNQE